MLKIAIAQFKPQLLNLKLNFERSIEFIIQAKSDIILFPELYLSGYTFKNKNEVKAISLSIEDQVFKTYQKLSNDYDMGICGGFAEYSNGKIFNSSFFIYKNSVHIYRKIHLFYFEKKFFEPGDTGFKVFEFKNNKIGMMICFDWIFPEAARTLALKGAQIILHPANLVLPFCQRAMFARAVENKVFIATANRIGFEKNGNLENNFTGQSQIVDPSGNYILTFSEDREELKSIEIDPSVANNKNITDLNNIFTDRKPEFYF